MSPTRRRGRASHARPPRLQTKRAAPNDFLAILNDKMAKPSFRFQQKKSGTNKTDVTACVVKCAVLTKGKAPKTFQIAKLSVMITKCHSKSDATFYDYKNPLANHMCAVRLVDADADQNGGQAAAAPKAKRREIVTPIVTATLNGVVSVDVIVQADKKETFAAVVSGSDVYIKNLELVQTTGKEGKQYYDFKASSVDIVSKDFSKDSSEKLIADVGCNKSQNTYAYSMVHDCCNGIKGLTGKYEPEAVDENLSSVREAFEKDHADTIEAAKAAVSQHYKTIVLNTSMTGDEKTLSASIDDFLQQLACPRTTDQLVRLTQRQTFLTVLLPQNCGNNFSRRLYTLIEDAQKEEEDEETDSHPTHNDVLNPRCYGKKFVDLNIGTCNVRSKRDDNHHFVTMGMVPTMVPNVDLLRDAVKRSDHEEATQAIVCPFSHQQNGLPERIDVIGNASAFAAQLDVTSSTHLPIALNELSRHMAGVVGLELKEPMRSTSDECAKLTVRNLVVALQTTLTSGTVCVGAEFIKKYVAEDGAVPKPLALEQRKVDQIIDRGHAEDNKIEVRTAPSALNLEKDGVLNVGESGIVFKKIERDISKMKDDTVVFGMVVQGSGAATLTTPEIRSSAQEGEKWIENHIKTVLMPGVENIVEFFQQEDAPFILYAYKALQEDEHDEDEEAME